jgi:hypothetical protein
MFNIVLQMNIEDGQRRVDPSCSRIDGYRQPWKQFDHPADLTAASRGRPSLTAC